MEVIGFPLSTVGAVALITLVAGLVKSTLGLGFGLVATPLLLFLLEPKSVVAFVIPMLLAHDVLLAVQTHRQAEWRRILPLLMPAMAGVALGTYLHHRLPPETVRLVVNLLVALAGMALLSGVRVRIRRERLASGLVGFSSGVLLPVATIAGPPVTIFLVNQEVERDALRATLAVYLLALDGVGLTALGVSGALTLPVVALNVVMLPIVLGNGLLARHLVRHLSTKLYHRLATLTLLASALVAVVGAVQAT